MSSVSDSLSMDETGDTPVENGLDSSQILKRLKEGGIDELSALFMKLRPQIRGMVESRLDRRLLSRVDASDIVQETFVRASNGLKSYLNSPKVHPVVWLRRIGKHLIVETCRHHFRSKRTPDREYTTDDDESNFLVNKVVDSMESVGSMLDRTLLLQKVRETLLQMPTMDREIIEMRHIDGLSLQDAAACLEIPLETTKKRYFRALKRFRELTQGFKST